jgi:hypothetical protein
MPKFSLKTPLNREKEAIFLNNAKKAALLLPD